MTDTITSTATGGRLRNAIVWAVLVATVLVTRAIWWGDPVADIDEGIYSLIGNGLLHGELPYVDNWDRKPFGLFALYALAHAIGGAGPAAFQVMAALFTLAGAWLVYRLALEMGEWVGALAAGVLYAAMICAYASHSGQSEALFMPVMLGALWLVRDPDHPRAFARACWAMLLGGIALQIKYTVIPQCLLLGGWVLWHEHRRGAGWPLLVRNAAIFAVIGLAPTLAVVAFYAAQGQLDAYVFANFQSFFDRIPAGQGRFHPRLMKQLVPIYLLVGLGLYAALRIRMPQPRRLYALCWLYFLASLATVYLPGTIYGYYFAALVPGAVLVALPFLDRRGPFRIVPAIMLVAAAFWILALPDRVRLSQDERATATRMASFIARHVDQRQCLYVFDGPTAFYRMSGSCRPTRFIYPDHLNNALERRALGISQEGEVARILAAKPPVIVTASKPFTIQNLEAKALVDDMVARDYTKLSAGGMHGRVVTAWVRRDDLRGER